MKTRLPFSLPAIVACGLLGMSVRAQRFGGDSTNIVKLAAIRAQDVCIMPDEAAKTYYMVAAAGGGVRCWTSSNLADWQGPKTIFRTPPNIWGEIRTAGIWAPEMHE